MSDFRSPPDSIRTFLESTPVPLTVADPHQPDAPLVLVNNGFCELTGYGLDEMIGQNCRFLQGDKDQPTARADIREALSHGADMQVVLDNQRKDGSRFQNLLLLSTIRSREGKVLWFVGSQFDVTAAMGPDSLDHHAKVLEDGLQRLTSETMKLHIKTRQLMSSSIVSVVRAKLAAL